MRRIPLPALTAMLLIAACDRFGNAAVETGGDRIVSVSKQATEIIFALGADDHLVGVDVSSVYPPEAKNLPTVGYHRALSLEGMLSVRPTLIVHAGPESMGPEHVVRQLEELHIPMKEFSPPTQDIEGAKTLIREMGTWFHREARAEELCAKLDSDMQAALAAAGGDGERPRVVIIHFGRASNVYLTITANSTAGKIIEWAGGRVVIDGSGGMQRLTSPEVIARSDPDIILLTDFGYDRLAGQEDILALPGVASTRAAREGRIYRVEENDLVYFGPRTGQVVLEMRRLLHDEERPVATAGAH